MNHLRMIAIPTKIAELVRTTMKAPGYGHPAHKEIAGGYGPCRHCLRTFRVGGEERILFTYDPFHEVAEFPLPGPIFIHAQECRRYTEAAGFPEELREHPLTLVAYGKNRTFLQEEYVADGGIELVAGRLFEERAVRYVHVRDTAAGCYDLRIERGWND
jgi:hypothetical protein